MTRAVWIVDDTEIVRISLGTALESYGLAVREAGSAAEFLANFDPAAVVCLIADHHMPDMTGLALLEEIRRRGLEFPVLLISGAGDAALRERALAAGATAMLHKPVDGDDVFKLIAPLL